MNKTCENCIHRELCNVHGYIDADECGCFKDKSRYIELPCAVGDDVYWIDSRDNTIQCEKNGIKGVAYYGGNRFKVITTDETIPEEIGTCWCCLSQEEAEILV